MNDTTLMLADSLTHTVDKVIHTIPIESTDPTVWIICIVTAIMAGLGWYKYYKIMKKK